MTIELNTYAISQSSARSKDGTVIGYKSIGNGPGVIILPGALSLSDDFILFAKELADSFTVHIIDRRGRGLSGPQGSDYSILKECEDLMAVQEETGASYIFGHSYGGLVVLETVRTNNVFTKVALYEPGVSINKSIPTSWFAPYERALDNNDTYKAFAIFIRAMGPIPNFLPLWYLKLILRIVLPKDEWNKMEALLLQSLFEHKEVGRLDSSYHNYSSIDSNCLFIAGEKSREAVRTINVLNPTMSNAKTLVLPQLGHLAPMERKTTRSVAQHVKSYFLG